MRTVNFGGEELSFVESNINYDKVRKITERPDALIHFVGIGGVSMYSLARLALDLGCSVSGSDVRESGRIAALRELGATVSIGHSKENLKDADLVVCTLAISDDNPELLAAQSRGIPLITRASFLGAMMLSYRYRIGVSGSHGKSTTTAILDAIFRAAGRDASILSGSDLPDGEPIRLASKDTLIYEACEYKDSFLRFSPSVLIALNLEYDHTDYFPSITALRESFLKALSRTDKAIVNCDDENLSRIIRKIKTDVVTYGQSDEADYKYAITSFHDSGYDFTLSKSGKLIGSFRVNLVGVFNVSNAAAAVVAALESGISAEIVADGLSRFSGISRRLEHVGDRYGRQVFYDYAHHPTEIRCAIDAVRMLYGDSVTVIFAPHTYTRTKSLWDGFISSLGLADYVALLDVYPAREEAIEGVNSAALAREIGKRAVYLSERELLSYIDKSTYGSIIVMGAGDMEKIKDFITDI